MTETEFLTLIQEGYNQIPLIRECAADLDTPVSLYYKLTKAPDGQSRERSFLLESVVGGERFGRYSFIGLPARHELRAYGQNCQIRNDGRIVHEEQGDPFEFLARHRAKHKPLLDPRLPRFCGGFAGYFGYDMVRFIEKRLGPSPHPDLLGTPDMLMLHVQELVVIDNLASKLYLVVYPELVDDQPATCSAAYQKAIKRLDSLVEKLRLPVDEPMPGPTTKQDPIRIYDKEAYLQAARKARDYIIAGDLMQVQIGQCIQKPFKGEPIHLYRALRRINPSPYMYYYDLGDFHIVGASPEILVREEPVLSQQDSKQNQSSNASTAAESKRITIRPIAGTRRRGSTPEMDQALAYELSNDEKEKAEHLMLIDLARNDIGRIAQVGSVEVTETMVVEKYSHVQHLVSNVQGLLKPGLTTLDVLKASFPAGTLTGAPKVRAMELIDELEITKRGIYGGAVGYLSHSGAMDVAIAIRTGIIKNQTLFVQAAAGIVYDSSPEAEYDETEMKARAVLRAAEWVEEGAL